MALTRNRLDCEATHSVSRCSALPEPGGAATLEHHERPAAHSIGRTDLDPDRNIPALCCRTYKTTSGRTRQGSVDEAREELEGELAQTTKWHQQPELFGSFLLGRILLITLASTFATIVPNLSTVLYIAFQAKGGLNFPYHEVFYGVGSFLGALLAALVAQLRARTPRIFRRVHNFEEYESRTRKQLSLLASQNGQPQTPIRGGDRRVTRSGTGRQRLAE